MNLENLTAEEIENLKVEKEKELAKYNEHYADIMSEEHRLGKELLELRIKKKDMDIMLERAKGNIKRLESDIRILTTEFWRKAKGRA